ncbi:MAG TPA: peptidylprolyl isomerase, partial [Planctomycetaceae bacterium]|nr:peptidylprolyl isomerase [Planctomycetaceae bacterium]
MGERNQASTVKASSGRKKMWVLVIGGTAVLLLAAGIMLQVTRPTSAFPDDGRASVSGKRTPGSANSSEQTPKRTTDVARVGKDKITYDELAAECIRHHGEETLDNLINRKIIQQACDAQGIEISEAEVSKEIESNAKRVGLAVDQFLQMLQAEQKITRAEYARDRVWPILALRKLAGEDVKITKKDLDRAFVSRYGPRVKSRAIFLDNPRRAQHVWEKAQENPDNFERLAQDNSVDPS